MHLHRVTYLLLLVVGIPLCALGAERPNDSERALSVAEPAPRSDDPWRRMFAVDVHLGVGTPLGFGGASTEFTPAPFFTVAAGVGANGDGMQEGLEARIRGIMRSGTAVAVGAGLSTGPYVASSLFELESSTRWHWQRAWWATVAFSVEHRWVSGVELRGYVGASILQNSTADSCSVNEPFGYYRTEPCTSLQSPHEFTPFLGLAFGYAFNLW